MQSWSGHPGKVRRVWIRGGRPPRGPAHSKPYGVPRHLVCALAASLVGHGGLLAGLLRMAPPTARPEAPRELEVWVTWSAETEAPRTVPDPGPTAETETTPEPPSPELPPLLPTPVQLLARTEVQPPSDLPVPPAYVIAVDQAVPEPADSNYWALVRAAISRHLRWPGGPTRSALVEVDLTLDGQGRVVDLRSRLQEGDARFVARVERAVRQASPFPPPAGHDRTASLPVRFLTQNRQGE